MVSAAQESDDNSCGSLVPGADVLESLRGELKAHYRGTDRPDLEGRRLGDFTLQERIGRGGTADIYLANQAGLDRAVAVKVLVANKLRADEFRRRFELEAKMTASFDHPSIVSAFAFGCSDGVHWLAMPLVVGSSLDRVIACFAQPEHHSNLPHEIPTNGPEYIQWVAKVAVQLASALEYAHERKTIHRDMKPGNVLIDERGDAKVTDFGLARILACDSNLTQTGAFVGTPRYMAPEQANSIVDKRSDIYGLGVTLWELLTRTRAFRNFETEEHEDPRRNFELAPVRSVAPDVPHHLASIIDRCCRYHPEERYQSASELLYVLRRFHKDQRIGDRRNHPRGSNSIRRWYLRRPTVWGLAIAVCLFTVLSGYRLASSVAVDADVGQVKDPSLVAMPVRTVSVQEFTRHIAWDDLADQFPIDPYSATLSGPDSSLFFVEPIGRAIRTRSPDGLTYRATPYRITIKVNAPLLRTEMWLDLATGVVGVRADSGKPIGTERIVDIGRTGQVSFLYCRRDDGYEILRSEGGSRFGNAKRVWTLDGVVQVSGLVAMCQAGPSRIYGLARSSNTASHDLLVFIKDDGRWTLCDRMPIAVQGEVLSMFAAANVGYFVAEIDEKLLAFAFHLDGRELSGPRFVMDSVLDSGRSRKFALATQSSKGAEGFHKHCIRVEIDVTNWRNVTNRNYSLHLSPEPLDVTIQNRSGLDIQAIWIDFDGKRKDYGRIKDGADFDMQSCEGHVWQFETTAGALVRSLTIGNSPLKRSTYCILPPSDF